MIPCDRYIPLMVVIMFGAATGIVVGSIGVREDREEYHGDTTVYDVAVIVHSG